MEINALLDGRLKVRHLVLAIAIADHGGIVRAAQHLHVTQPVITRGLKELEALLEVQLFDRTPKGVTPTVFADAFLVHARAVLAHLRQASLHVSELSDATTGTVTVATHVAGANLMLPLAIAQLKADRPKVKVVVREGLPDRLASDLASGDVDVIVGRRGHTLPDIPVRQLELYAEPFRVVCRHGHPALALTNPALGDLQKFPWILPGGQTSLRGELEELLRREGAEFPEQQIECTAPLTVRTLVEETDYLAVLPQTLASTEPRLALVSTSLEGISRTIVATYASEYAPSPSTALLLRHLSAAGQRMQAVLPRTI